MERSALRLWQLISPALPVGAYSYSQGLEYAIECGWVNSAAAAQDWIAGQMEYSLAALDVPVFERLYAAWAAGDAGRVAYWNGFMLASRETAELYAEDLQTGGALAKLLYELEVPAGDWADFAEKTCFLNMFALAAVHWRIEAPEAARGYLWAWCENQVMAAVKLMPLGQTAGQRILLALGGRIGPAVEHGMDLAEADIGRMNPRAALASALHETQYSRLFRS